MSNRLLAPLFAVLALALLPAVAPAPSEPASGAQGEATRLLRQPTVSDSLIAFACANDIRVVPRSGGAARRLTSFRGDFPWTREHWKDAGDMITDAEISPTGARALFQARGEILTMPG